MLTLLGARSSHLPATFEHCLTDWIWKEPQGIGYLSADLQHPMLLHIFNWLESLEILSHFQSWHGTTKKAIEWLWNQQSAEGWWDFGVKVSNLSYFPLSDNWRKTGNRSVDHSTRVLVLLRHFSSE